MRFQARSWRNTMTGKVAHAGTALELQVGELENPESRISPFSLECFKLRCWARARFCAEGILDLHLAINTLVADAARDGIEHAVAHQIMVEEFEPLLRQIPRDPPQIRNEEFGSSAARPIGADIDPPRVIKTSREFVDGFVPPDYLIDGILQLGFFYSLTGKTGGGKTAIALLIAASTALGQSIGAHSVRKGRVLFFAGENPDDLRMRWIAMAENMRFDINTIDVHFIAGTFKISDMAARIAQEVQQSGELALVVVDTSAAFFEGEDENSNAQVALHARRLRSLVDLAGRPTVLVNCHPTKNAADDNLLPRGGGAFVAEVDGNLTARKKDSAVELHWQGKFRGPDFVSLSFQLKPTTSVRLHDSKGRPIPSVMAEYLTDTAQDVLTEAARRDENLLLADIAANPLSSMQRRAVSLNWLNKDRKPNKVKVQRTQEALLKAKLIETMRGKPRLTERGLYELPPHASNFRNHGR